MAQQWPAAAIPDQIIEGFQAYRDNFRRIALCACERFELAQWQDAQQASTERIESYEKMAGAVRRALLRKVDHSVLLDVNLWPQIKSAYINLIDLRFDDELAE